MCFRSSNCQLMPKCQLGKNGPKTSVMNYGAMSLSSAYGIVASDEERFKILDRAIELEITYIDTADIYGDCEDLLEKYFKKYPQKRQKVNNNKKRFFSQNEFSNNSTSD